MTLDELKVRITALNRGKGAFYGFETETKPKLNKKNRTTKEPTNFEVTIKARFSAMLGVNYENCVNNALERQGLDRTFEAQKPFGKHYLEGSTCLMTDDKTGTKFYLAVDRVGGMTKTFFIDGREATEAEVEDLKINYLQKPSTPTAGVTWRTYGIESIKVIR